MLGFPDKPSLETVFHCWQLYYNIFKTKPLVVKLKINYFVKLYIFFFKSLQMFCSTEYTINFFYNIVIVKKSDHATQL